LIFIFDVGVLLILHQLNILIFSSWHFVDVGVLLFLLVGVM